MTETAAPATTVPPSAPLARLPAALRWTLLVALSAAAAAALTAARLPAALLLGPMLAAIALACAGAGLRVPQPPYLAAQAVLGALVATLLNAGILHAFLHAWPLFLGVVTVIIVANCALGWVLGRLGLMPGSTAIWGLLPGAASAMMVMAEAYGADARLVAFMQYTRVALVASSTSLLARFVVHPDGPAPAAPPWFPQLHQASGLETAALILGGLLVGRASRLPAGVLLVTLAAGATLQIAGVITIALPRWLLAAAYACLGWQIGLRFTGDVVRSALRALFPTALALLLMMAFCAGLAGLLSATFGIDFLTTYLATSPGGLDAIAIIAATTKVDVGFVMALQCARFLLVLAIGPTISRFFVDRMGGGQGVEY